MREKKLEIYFDMDGVLANLDATVISIMNQELGMNYNYINNNSYWWLDTGVNKKYFENLLFRKGLFKKLEPIADMIDVVNNLKSEGYDIYFLTMPQYEGDCFASKGKWLKKYFKWVELDKHYIATGNKKLLAKPHRILVDDNAEFLIPWSREGGIAIGFGGKNWTLKYKGFQITKACEIYDLIKLINN